MFSNHIHKFFAYLAAILMLLAGIGSVGKTNVLADTPEPPVNEAHYSPAVQQMIKDGTTITQLDDLLPIIYELETLNLAYIRQPGWYHSVQESFTASPGDHEGKPTEGMFPQRKITDTWGTVVDAEGTLGLGTYTVISNTAGERIQVLAVDENGLGGNITLLERGLEDAFGSRASEGEEAWQASLPTTIRSGLTHYISSLIEFAPNRVELAAWVETQDGELVLRVHKVHRYPVAYEFDDIHEPLLGSVIEDTISLKNGEILKQESTATLASGLQIPWVSIRNTLVEPGVEMPPDVFAAYQADVARAVELEDSKKGSQPQADITQLPSSISKYNYVGSSTAVASSSNTVVDEFQMICIGISKIVSPAQPINVIGGTWMGCSQKCRAPDGSEFTQNTRTVGGWASYSSSYSEKWTNGGWEVCPSPYSTSIQVTQTNHEFNHTNCVHWLPQTNYYSYQ
ncbi:MAG: hypothetical protein WA110_01700 [Anaerolineaceae bacterium]